VIGGGLFLLSACAGNMDFERVAKMPSKGTPFQANKVGALSGARVRLVNALAGGAKARAPKHAARAGDV
jgi:hypothetical protein